MKSTLKKFLSITLVVSMLMSMCTFAFADSAQDQVGKYLEYGGNGTPAASAALDASYKANDDDVTMDKTITQKGDNLFQIDLTVTTKEKLQDLEISDDAAVVLVIDTSNSMIWNAQSQPKNLPAVQDQRLTKAKAAAIAFVESFAKDAGNAKRMVSIVQFYGSASTKLEWKDAAKTDDLKTIKDTINTKLSTGSSTNIDGGLQEAYKLLGETEKGQALEDIKSTFVILLTDGSPNEKNSKNVYGNNYSSGTQDYQAAGISAEAIKTDRKAVLYTLAFDLGTTKAYNKNVEVEHECNQTGWHRHDQNSRTANGYGSGTEGRMINGQFSEHIVKMGSTKHTYYDDCNSGWFNGPHTGKTTEKQSVTVEDWLSNEIASTGCGKEVGENITIDFLTIVQRIKTLMQAWSVEDPMGQYINYVEGSASNNNASFKDGKLTWLLWKETVTPDANGVYTYKMSYKVTLDTAAEGFEEGKFYPTNGATKLNYIVNLTDEEGNPNPDITDQDLKSDYFNVPTVKGEIPEYPFSIEYYKQGDATKGDYENYTKVKTTDGEKTDLHTVISLTDKDAGYKTKYANDNYHIAKANTQITISATPSANVIKVYYDKDTTNVTVNHYYKLTTIAKDGSTSGDNYADEGKKYVAYVGESFTATEQCEYGGKKYTKVKAEPQMTIQSLQKETDENKNVINIYYELEQDLRDPASVVVDHVYRLHTWTLNPQTGKYELVDAKPHTEEKVEKSDNLKAHDTYTAKNEPIEGYKDYTPAENNQPENKDLAAGENKITLYFDKTVDERVKSSAKVIHHYTKTVTNIVAGKPVTEKVVDDVQIPESINNKFVDETYTVSEKTNYNGETYVSDEGNAAKCGTKTMYADTSKNETHLYYTLVEEPATTTVTVNHYYRTTTTTTVLNEETGEYEDKTEIATQHGNDDVVISDTLYVGQSYTADTKYKDGFKFTSAEPSNRTVKAADNNASVINLYYDKAEDGRTDANINARHIYTTIWTTIVNGAVGERRVTEDPVTMDTEKTGKVGDAYSFSPITDHNGYTDWEVVKYEGSPASGKLKVPEENEPVEIYYERNDSDLVSTTYTVNYNYKTYTMFVDTDGVAKYPTEPTVETGTPVNGIGYVNQKVTITDGAKGDFTAEGTNPATEQILKASGNEYTFNYVKYVPLGTGSVQVNHHYTTTTKAVDGSESTMGFDVPGGITEKYIGEAFSANAVPNGYKLDRVTVDNAAAEAGRSISVTVKEGMTVIDFYYSKTVDNSQPVDYSITHIYKTIDWNGKETVETTKPITGESFATKQLSAATASGEFDLVAATFNGEAIEGFDKADPQDTYAVILVNGKNEIVYTYEKHIDTRDDKDVSVKVIHNYFKRDTYTTDAALSNEDFIKDAAAEYVTEMNVVGKDNGIWIGNSYTAEKILSYTVGEGDEAETLTYAFVNADPESMKVELTKAGEYVITINYLREYSTDPGDTSYVVTHVYCRNGVEETRVTGTPIDGKVGSVVNASDIGKITENNGRTYRFVSASPESITLEKDVVGELILTYNRTTGGGGGGGGYTPTPKPDPIPEPPVDDEEIVDEDVPLAALPVPGDEELEDFEEEEVPLANVPRTSDMALFWLASSALSGIGLGALNLKKREDEDEQ